MQKLKDIPNNSILVIPENIKLKVLKLLEKENLKNIKILTLQELQKKFYFDYDDRALFFLIEKYNYQYDVAKMYLSRMYEVVNNDFDNPKIKKITNLIEELADNNLLIYSKNFKDYLKNKLIVFYDVEPLDKLYKKMIDEIKEISNVKFIQNNKEKYKPKCIYEFLTIEEEVLYISSKIKELKVNNISFNNIKICNASGEYLNLIKRIFKWYHIPITINDNFLYATTIGQYFLNNLNKNTTPEIILNNIKELYPLTIETNLNIYNQIIEILNNYIWIEDISKLKIFLIKKFKITKVGVEKNIEEVTLIDSLQEADEEDYIFLLGFNQSEYPKTYKDESYFNDILKEKLGLETTNEQNKRIYQKCLQEIYQTKNLIITTKLTSSLGEHYLSSLNDDLNLEIKKEEISYQDSNLYNKLTLGKKIDTFVKYNEKSKDLELLYSNYKDIEYATYNSDYQQIPKNKIRDYLNNNLTLSYSAMNTYFQCGFRYYLSNILKLNIFEETFYTVLGNLFHHLLSIALDKDINLKEEYNNYLNNCKYKFNSREKFFLTNLEDEIEYIINIIKKQNETNSLTKSFYEEKITINKNRNNTEVTFKGFVDKIMTNDEENIISIIDYKTGNPELNLNNVIHGLDLQLPVYIYLAKQKFKEAKVAGFYLQKILNNEITKDYKHTYESLKADKLKLQGYSNSDISILEQFDSSYYESKMIKGMRTTSKGLATKKVLTDEQIDKLAEITNEKIDETIDNILNASFEINPKRIGLDNLGCKYCQFNDICFKTEKNIVDLKEYKNIEFLGGDEDDTTKTQ